MDKLLKKYQELCAIPYVKGEEPYSDISFHLPKLKEYAMECDVIVELGVRRGHSTVALLSAAPAWLYSYDLVKWDDVNEIEALAAEYGLGFTFNIGNSLALEIPQNDMLFIDTLHTKTQLERELARHAHRVSKFIALHDTSSFGLIGEPGYEAVAEMGTNCGQGIQYAIDGFLNAHSDEWMVDYVSTENNGLTVLMRVVK